MVDDAVPDDSELPGTPESRKADGDCVRERTADAVRRLRRSVREVLKVVRDRFQTLPLRCGSERHRIAVSKLFDATNVLGIVLTNLPRTPKIDGTIGESVLTWDGLTVPQARLEDYISAVSWLREAADELKALTSEKEGLPNTTAIPEELVRGLENAERMLAFADAEESSVPATINPNVSVETTAKERPTCPADLEPTNAAEMLRWEIAKRIAPSLGPLPPSGEHEKAMTRFLKPFNRSPHHRTVWEHYNKLRKIEADDLPRWESEAKSAGLTLQDYIDKLALPHMVRFIAFNGIPLPPESSETQTPAVRADDDANETTQLHSNRNGHPGDGGAPPSNATIQQLLESCRDLAQQYPWLCHVAVRSQDLAVQRLFITPVGALNEKDKVRRARLLADALHGFMGVDQFQPCTPNGIPTQLKVCDEARLRCGHLIAMVDIGPMPIETAIEVARVQFLNLSFALENLVRDENWQPGIREPRVAPNRKSDGSTVWIRILYEMGQQSEAVFQVPLPDAPAEKPEFAEFCITGLRDNVFVESARQLGLLAGVPVDWVNGLFPRQSSDGQFALPALASPSAGEKPVDDVAETVKRVSLLLGADGGKIMAIVSHAKFSTEQKLRALGALDERFKGYKSPVLCELLDVSPGSVTNSDVWREWNPLPAKRAKPDRK